MNTALHWTGQEISKRNISKPPQIRGSKKTGQLKRRLSLKTDINLLSDWSEEEADNVRQTEREIGSDEFSSSILSNSSLSVFKNASYFSIIPVKMKKGHQWSSLEWLYLQVIIRLMNRPS